MHREERDLDTLQGCGKGGSQGDAPAVGHGDRMRLPAMGKGADAKTRLGKKEASPSQNGG